VRSSRKVEFSASSSYRHPAEAKFLTVRYLAAPWIGCKFKASSLQVAGFDCTWVAARCLKIMSRAAPSVE
jgi:hypothetical protein